MPFRRSVGGHRYRLTVIALRRRIGRDFERTFGALLLERDRSWGTYEKGGKVAGSQPPMAWKLQEFANGLRRYSGNGPGRSPIDERNSLQTRRGRK
jgi:hypothetical protein